MRKSLSLALALLSSAALSAIPVKDNSDTALALSQGNYNRLVVKNDKIMEAVFPPNSMAIKRDEQDGSVYILLSASNPFTLFLTTEAGRHFSLTLSGEEALGKTIELIPATHDVAVSRANALKTTPGKTAQESVPETILALLNAMEQQKPLGSVQVKRQYGNVQRWSKGLTLLPRESWDNSRLKGEIIELYNGGKKPLDLEQEWFAKDQTLAVKFSKSTIAPGEKAMLYRVQGVGHG
ncbi:conjugal transfer protein TraK [Legionella massiliensis]|uniref:Conjugal transfer protein TraK n=1 Tax=Legionella massiliensis TaxID=1034943 RepID=A0A078L2I2_9GAMM|nr:type-F conjugative transfer system secretin TraK [Legionella massiliensis]CDZ79401.1 conjugal transfer protein TraK [Legionella massiliensis]CEE15139.1 TraK protein [Legionella massiliensis]